MEEIDGDRLETTFGTFLKIGNVAAGTEGPGAAREYYAADRVQVLGLAQCAGHFGIHRLCQRVLLFRTVHPDHANAILVRYQNLVGHGSPAVRIGMPALWEGSRLPLNYSRHHWSMAARAAVRKGMPGAIDAPQSLIGVKPKIMLRPAWRQYAGAKASSVGRSQVVRQRILIPPFGGSNPPAPANQSDLTTSSAHSLRKCPPLAGILIRSHCLYV